MIGARTPGCGSWPFKLFMTWSRGGDWAEIWLSKIDLKT